MMGYTKLFSEIIMSTVWRESDHVRILWITMLALKDRWHVVNASIPGLADAARISIPECEKALKILSEPDPHSRSAEFEGRRIESCDGGWIILNGEKYRNKMSLDERREYQRIKQREYRERQKSLNSCQQKSQQFTHTDTDTDTKKKKGQNKFDRFWSVYPKKVKKKTARDIWKRKHLDDKADDLVSDVNNRLKNDGRWLEGFIPDPTTYLNQERWEDEITERKKKSNGVPPASQPDDLLAFAKRHGINSKPGEDYNALYRRCMEAIR